MKKERRSLEIYLVSFLIFSWDVEPHGFSITECHWLKMVSELNCGEAAAVVQWRLIAGMGVEEEATGTDGPEFKS